MSSEQIIWLAGAAFAMTFLLKMMRDRQIALNQLIRTSVDEKVQWSRKKAKAAKLARKTARKKAAEEKVLAGMIDAESSPVQAEGESQWEDSDSRAVAESAS